MTIVVLFFVCALAHLANLLLLHLYSTRKKNHLNEIEDEIDPIEYGKKTNIIKILYGGWVRYYLRRLGNVPSHFIRLWILKKVFLMDIEKNAVIYGGFEIRSPWNIHIGAGTIVGDESKLDGRNGIYISDNVNLSTGVWIWTEQHDYNDSLFRCNNKGKEVRIENRCWIGSRVTILPGSVLHEGCVIASGAVVTRECDAFSVYGGIPAKRIADRNRDLIYRFDGSFIPFY